MKIRRIVSVILPLFLILTLTGCNLRYWFEELPSDDLEVRLERLTVNGVDITSYAIYYQPCETDVRRWSSYYYGADYDYGLICAQTLQQTILSVCDAVLPIYDSFNPENVEKAILVGFAAGPYLPEPLAYNETFFSVVGDVILLCGGSEAANYQSISLFLQQLQILSAGKEKADLSDGFVCKKTSDVSRIACLGDSLTFGTGSDQPKYLSYPAALGRLCWKFASVDTYALPQACALPTGDFPLISSGMYEECLSMVGEYDYVILLLGTYDSYYVSEAGKTWDFTTDSDFLVSYLEISERLLTCNEDCILFVVNSPIVSESAQERGYALKEIRLLQKKAYDTLLAKDYNVHFVDLYENSADLLSSYLKNDGVTYTSAGYYCIADQIFEQLVSYMDHLRDENAFTS